MHKTMTLMKKELWSYFSTPTAFIFLMAYLFVSFFTFFWVEKFFTRNIADLRPLFESMPVLMIFLVSTITMRMWSEEKKSGTVEFLMTLPVKTWELVLGKFLSCFVLVLLALSLTLFLPASISVMSGGALDWGPVWGGYFASLLLASSYIAIGLFISSKTESQIISLILTSFVCLIFYFIGSRTIVGLLGSVEGEFLKLLSSGGRFESISRGVMDLRDIYYYLSLTAVFLVLNIFSLEKSQWSLSGDIETHRAKFLVMGALVLNILFANLWLHGVSFLRIDMTEKKIYSISEASKKVLLRLEEPLLIRGYISERTHPLLAPLVPLVTDLLGEYQLVNQDLIQVKVDDPKGDSEMEAEAARKYNVEAASFHVADRYSSSLVNSYFHLVVQYGDQYEVLAIPDLIDVKESQSMKGPEVRLKNLEYSVTRAIKKTVYAFNNTDNLFASLSKPVRFVAYVSEDKLPEDLKKLTQEIKESLTQYQDKSQGKLEVSFQDPSRDSGLAEKISEDYGFSPQSTSHFSNEMFYFYLTLQDDDKIFQLGVPENFEVAAFNKDLDAALKRLSPGFLRTVGVYTPPSSPVNPMLAQYGMASPGGKTFNMLMQKLAENYRVQPVDLDKGVVNSDLDTLLVMAPRDLNEKQIFAIDQYLMRGASIILVTSPIIVKKEREGFSSEVYESGLKPWLAHFGVEIKNELVLDENNMTFPDVRKRVVEGYSINEPYLAPYPLFPDVRGVGFNEKQAITSSLRQITFAWGSPIQFNKLENKQRKITTLLTSSKKSWTQNSLSIERNRDLYPEYGFEVPIERASSTFGVMLEGVFDSFFKGKKSPLLASKGKDSLAHEDHDKHEKAESYGHEEGAEDEENKSFSVVTSVIEKSPKSASLIVYSSNEVFADDTIQIQGMLTGNAYLNSLELMENSVDWILEDRALMLLRNRRHFARTLGPLADVEKRNWELLNYFLPLLGLFLLFGVYHFVRRSSVKRYQELHLTHGGRV